MELTSVQQYKLEEAQKSLSLAKQLLDQNRLARAQEVLRDAQALFFQLPRGFTDPDFEQQYNQLYSKLYRGY